jgi:hypothetical protein
MKRLLVLLVLLVCPILAVAQSEERDMRTLLQDSSYVFNRFEETTTGLDFQIDSWNVPASLKTTLKEVLSGRLRSVRAEKRTLNALLLKNEVPSSDLFDVYSEMIEVTSELQDQASNFANWGDSTKATELAQLGSKANILAANIGMVLREKIEKQEAQLATCSGKLSSPTAKHK